jgi:hypothetical protein
MFSVRQKREISDKIQAILRETGHPELPEGEIRFKITVYGAQVWSFANIENNGSIAKPDVNPWNESQDKALPEKMVFVNARNVEQLKIFYALFQTIMDEDPKEQRQGTYSKMEKLRGLRKELAKVYPDQ